MGSGCDGVTGQQGCWASIGGEEESLFEIDPSGAENGAADPGGDKPSFGATPTIGAIEHHI